MSSSPNAAGQDSEESEEPSAVLRQLIRDGRSWSGREKNCFFLNTNGSPTAQGRYATISAISGVDYPEDGRAVALVDWDHDGDQDLWISNRNAPRLRLLRNDTPSGNHWLQLQLVGNGTTTTRDAIGARVEVVTSGSSLPLVKTLRAGEGFLAQSSKWLHFGLGTIDEIEAVTVRWPGGEVQQWVGIGADRRYRLSQGSEQAAEVGEERRDLQIEPSTPDLPEPTAAARLPMYTLITLPQDFYLDFDGQPRPMIKEEGLPLLVNLWATWCRPCVAELREIKEREEELRARGIHVLALSVDGLDDGKSQPLAAKQMLESVGYPFESGQATAELVTRFQFFFDHLAGTGRRLPVPSSFLIDTEGKLAVIYKGPLTVDDLLKDVDHSHKSRLERLAAASLVAGTPINLPQLESDRITREMSIRFGIAQELQVANRYEEAARQYSDALETMPDDVRIRNKLAGILVKLDQTEKAISQLREAVRIDPDFPDAHYNLANLLSREGDFGEAARHFEQFLQRVPDSSVAHSRLAEIYLTKLGRVADAITHYRQSLVHSDEDLQAANNLAWLLATSENPSQEHLREALRWAKHAVQAGDSRDPTHLDTLAVTYAALGDFERAVTTARTALDLCRQQGRDRLVSEIQQRLDSYLEQADSSNIP